MLVVYEDLAEVHPYVRAIEASGGKPRPSLAQLGLTLGVCSGLLLTGGVDVDPALYGEIRLPETQSPNPTRDTVETILIKEALDCDIPLLAICRGMQILNACLASEAPWCSIFLPAHGT